MNDDELMDELLRRSMPAKAPELSPGFDARVMRHASPRRLTASGKALIAVYAVVATGASAWLMRDVPVNAIVAGLAGCAAIAGSVSVYVRTSLRAGNEGPT